MTDVSSWVYWSMTDYGGLGESELPKHYDLADSSTSFHLADAEWSVQYGETSSPVHSQPPTGKRTDTTSQPTARSPPAPSRSIPSP